jgi:hypothetical protein
MQVYCNDGFNFSVICGARWHYADPEEKTVEIGFISEPQKELEPWIEGAYDDPTECVYPYVPVEVMEEVIDLHGGVNWIETITKEKR